LSDYEGIKKEFIAEAEDLLEESQRLLIEIQETYASGLNPDTINASSGPCTH